MLASPAILPPFTGGNPGATLACRSPYRAGLDEVVQRFGKSAKRQGLLRGLIQYRRELRRVALGAKFQWLAGSFVEEPGREPNDIDVVTFFETDAAGRAAAMSDPLIKQRITALAKRGLVKTTYGLDSFFIDLSWPPHQVVAQTHYWYGLFSHQRVSYAWKGMLEVDAQSVDDDYSAEALLSGVRP